MLGRGREQQSTSSESDAPIEPRRGGVLIWNGSPARAALPISASADRRILPRVSL